MNNYFKANGANQFAIGLAVVVLALAALVAWFGYDTTRAAAMFLPLFSPSSRS